MKIKTNLTLDKDRKIVLELVNRKKIIIKNEWNKGIDIYRKWLENENGCLVNVELEKNYVILISEKEIKIFSPGNLE